MKKPKHIHNYPLRLSDEDMARVERIQSATGIDKMATVIRNAIKAYEEQLNSVPGKQQDWLTRLVRKEIRRALATGAAGTVTKAVTVSR